MDMQSAPAAPVATLSGTDKIWSLLCHLSIFIGVPFLLPLVVYLAMNKDSEYVRRNAAEALNFHISMAIYGLGGFLFCAVGGILIIPLLIGVPLLFALGVFTIVMAIVAAIKASDGYCYRYPLTIHFI